jgi:ketosteroid isomerase-like protein
LVALAGSLWRARSIASSPSVTSLAQAGGPDRHTSKDKETAMDQPLGDPAADERELTELVKELNDAVVKADLAALEQLLHEDYVHQRPRGEVESRAQYLANRKDRRVDFDSLVPDDMEVRVYGDTAIVTGRSTAKGHDQHGTMDEQRRWTRVLVRRDGRWQFVHFQGTPIATP